MAERIPAPEFSERGRALIEKLREKFPDDPEVHAMMLAWCNEEEPKPDAAAGEGDAERANIEFELKKARLYKAAEYYKQAWETLQWARDSAHNLGNKDLYDRAEALMDELDDAIDSDSS